MNRPYEPPNQDRYDHIERAARALVKLVPGGSSLMEYVAAPIDARRTQWMNDVADGLRKLEERVDGFTIESLAQDEAFVTAMLRASHAALRTHQKEKRRALRNAVLNVAIGRAPEDDLQLIFLGLIDDLTPLHLRMLALFADPMKDEAVRNALESISMGGLSLVLEKGVPELRGKRELSDLIYKDLEGRGLLVGGGLHVTMTGRGLRDKRTTALGDDFLRFVASPVEDADAG